MENDITNKERAQLFIYHKGKLEELIEMLNESEKRGRRKVLRELLEHFQFLEKEEDYYIGKAINTIASMLGII